MNRFLCIWLPNWPIQRRRAERPALHRQAMVLYEPGDSTAGQLRVMACCDLAMACGAKVGLPLVEAVSLLAAHGRHRKATGAPAVHVEACEAEEDRHALEKLARWCDGFSPRVAVEEASRAESLFLDLTGVSPLFGGETALGRRIVEAYAARRFIVRLAVADTIGTAWAVAHYVQQAARTPQIVPPGRCREWLAPLPVEALRLDRRTTEQLVWLGIERIEQLLAIRRSSLASRFGPALLQRIDQALGHREEPLVAVAPSQSVVAGWSWEFPVAERGVIETGLAHLAQQLAEMLQRRQRGALRLACHLRGRVSRTVVVGMLEPSASAEHWLELLRLRLERERLDGPVEEVRLEVAQHAPLVAAQRLLFQTDDGADTCGELARLIDRLSGRLGARAVGGVRLLAEAQPELAYRLERLSARHSAGRARSNSGAGLGPLDRPLRLLRPELLKPCATKADRPPRRFRFRGMDHQIARYWGPERIETGWWRRRGARRDYYRVETIEGARFWLFRDLDDGRWFVQGEFA